MYLGVQHINFRRNIKEKIEEIKYEVVDKILPEFSKLSVSIETIVLFTNITFHIKKIFEYLPYNDYIVSQKRRGRRKKDEIEDNNINIPPMSIISLKMGNKLKGVDLKKRDDENKKHNYFRNSISIKIAVSSTKLVDMKIPEKGQLQITGCKNKTQCLEILRILYIRILQTEKMIGEKLITKNSESFTVIPITMMRNYNFKTGFFIDRDKFHNFINNSTEFTSIYESTIDSSVNVKYKNSTPFDEKLDMTELKVTDKINLKVELVSKILDLELFFNSCSDKDAIKLVKKDKYISFLCFHTGSINFTGVGPRMECVYENFKDIIIKNRSQFEKKSIQFQKKAIKNPFILRPKLSNKFISNNPLLN